MSITTTLETVNCQIESQKLPCSTEYHRVTDLSRNDHLSSSDGLRVRVCTPTTPTGACSKRYHGDGFTENFRSRDLGLNDPHILPSVEKVENCHRQFL